MLRKLSNKSLKKYLLFTIFMVFIIAISTPGVTYAWFTTSSITLENIFTAGTVEIEAEDITEVEGTGSDTDIISPGDSLEKSYRITNVGSKSIYVRARFEGYWKSIYHKNTATATAYFNNMEVSDNDIAHFYYENQEQVPGQTTGPSAGFTGGYDLTRLLEVSSNSSSNDDTTNADNQLYSQSSLTSSSWTEYPADCSGPKVDPITGDDTEFSDYFNGGPGPDPNPDKLPYPGDCTERNYFKIDLDQDDVINDKTYTIADNDVESNDNQTGFEVTIFKSKNNEFFAFVTNQAVYHVYVKGGKQEGNLYMYYPDHSKGVTEDCGLVQSPNPQEVASGWSHITFYYCEADPQLELTKEVSVDDGNTWDDAEQSPGSYFDEPSIVPRFRFTVENTGNVMLEDIEVADDVLDLDPDNESSTTWIINELAPDQTDELKIDYVEWTDIVQMNNIKVELCNDMVNWVPEGPQDLGTYFYHTGVLKAEGNDIYQVDLCVNITLEDDGGYYEGTEFTLYSFFEAVQASNDIIKKNWPEEDLGWYIE